MKRRGGILVSLALLLTLVLLAISGGYASVAAMGSYDLAGSGSVDAGAIGYSGWVATASVLLFVLVSAGTTHWMHRRRH